MRALTFAAVLLIAAAAAFAQTQRGEKNDRFAKRGIQVGQALPADTVKVIRLDGKDGNLARAWKDRPALIVTSSLTCPVARRKFESLRQIAREYHGRLWVVIVYTVEAHPEGSPSPYSGKEWVTPRNEREGILRAQPQTIEQRIALAREFRDRMKVNVAIGVDPMDNAVWTSLGGGPNLAVLVDTGGKVVAKHGWFDAGTMKRSIETLLATKAPTTQPAE